MSFLRRMFGGGGATAPGSGTGPAGTTPTAIDAAQADAEDAARERDLLREDARRLSDDLLSRQLRYADRSWTPPAQGGERRADDDAKGADER